MRRYNRALPRRLRLARGGHRGRIYQAGAAPWRMAEIDYRRAVKALPEGSALPLSGSRSATIWDPRLVLAMTELGVAVHEESLLETLLRDLR